MSPQVAGLSEVATNSAEEVMRLLQRGNKERTQEPTAANKTSSRSHALLMVNVTESSSSRAVNKRTVRNGRWVMVMGWAVLTRPCLRLYMIDLAGSERAANTKNAGIRLKEGAHINRSLLALGNCINALAEKKTKFVNYRDSKLTRLACSALRVFLMSVGMFNWCLKFTFGVFPPGSEHTLHCSYKCRVAVAINKPPPAAGSGSQTLCLMCTACRLKIFFK